MNKINQSAIFQLADEIGWEAAGNGIQRQVYGYSQELMLVKVRFIKGAVGDLHSHPHVQSSFVESGVFELNCCEKTQIVDFRMNYLQIYFTIIFFSFTDINR